MTKISSLAFGLLMLTAFGLQSASAQFRVPDITQIKKPKVEPPPKGGSESAPATTPTADTTGVGAARTDTPVAADTGPQIIKTRLHVRTWQNSSYWPPQATKEQDDTTSWVPVVRFRVRGPLPSGTQFSVDVTKPDGSLWVSFDCPAKEIGADEWLDVETRRDPPGGARVFTTATGVFGFTIRFKNVQAGQNQAIYSGKFNVGKVDKSRGNAARKNVVTYYVDHDWTLPIGQIWSEATQAYNVHLRASMWFKGSEGPKAAYLFYKGQQVGSTKDSGDAIPIVELRTFDNDRGDPRWERIDFKWYSANFTAEYGSKDPSIFFLDKNPGNYEIKVMCAGALCRETKFSIGPDGKIVDNGVDMANKISAYALMLPVKVIGTHDGQWQPMAWKTDAFYGNPLQGFNVP